jgi:hypothetical protein
MLAQRRLSTAICCGGDPLALLAKRDRLGA